MSTKGYIMTISASNFIEGEIPKYHPENTKLGTDGSQKLVGMIQDAFGKDAEFYPIHSSLLASTDDTTLFIICSMHYLSNITHTWLVYFFVIMLMFIEMNRILWNSISHKYDISIILISWIPIPSYVYA